MRAKFLKNEPSFPPLHRQKILLRLANYIYTKIAFGITPQLVFVCTHNSRRSQMAQVLAQYFAGHAGIAVRCHSAGTEQTACNPRTVAALKRAGFTVETAKADSDNPHYSIAWARAANPVVLFSKTLGHPSLPEAGFAAVMTCSDADANCPIVPGCELRLPLTYDDPKLADGTPQEKSAYDDRIRQIAEEMHWLFSHLAND